MANQVQLMVYEGYLVADPVMRFTPNGAPVTNFRMGSNNSYVDKEGKKVDEVTWIKVTAWGKQAEIVNNLCTKGTHVIVTGKLRPGANGSPEVFEMKNGGHGASFEMTADPFGVRILTPKPKDGETYEDEDGGLPY